MKLYVCNATTRNLHLHYRVPEVNKVFDVTIPPGNQRLLHHQGPDEVKAIIDQISAFGAVPVAEVGRNPEFSGVIYSTDKVIDIDAIRAGFSAVDQAAIDAAIDSREKNAIAADEHVARLAQEAGVAVGNLVVEVKEDRKPGDTEEGNHSKIEVMRNGNGTNAERKTKQRK